MAGWDQRCTPNPAAANPAMVPGTEGNASAATHARRRDQPARADHGAFAEPVDQSVPDQPPDEHEPDQRDVAEHRDRDRARPDASRRYSVAQEFPASSTIAPAIGDHHQSEQRGVDRDAGIAPPAGAARPDASSWSGPGSRKRYATSTTARTAPRRHRVVRRARCPARSPRRPSSRPGSRRPTTRRAAS